MRHVTYNHPRMSAEVEVVVPRVTDLAVNDSPCRSVRNRFQNSFTR